MGKLAKPTRILPLLPFKQALFQREHHTRKTEIIRI